jgi:two-component system chemotaxis response regulator CheB
MKKKLILIGASTGGPGHLKKIFLSLKTKFHIPIVIAQHMNPVFITSFVKQFDDELPFNFYLASKSHEIEDNSMFICATHCGLCKKGNTLKLESSKEVQSHYNPSVDNLFDSAVKLTDSYDILAILLTGIGQDGAHGLAKLKEAGATCIAESEESAIVFGMPKKAAELNSDIKVMSLDKIINYIKQFGGA